MRARRAIAYLPTAVIVVWAAAPLSGAHEEEPGSARKHTIARGEIPTGGRYHLFGQRATIEPDHIHRGAGDDICFTLEEPRGSAGNCGPRPTRPARRFVLASGFRCAPAWSHAYGIVGPRADRVYARFGTRRRVRAKIRRAPTALALPQRVRFFIAVARGGASLVEAWAVDARGRVLKRVRMRDPTKCGAAPAPVTVGGPA